MSVFTFYPAEIDALSVILADARWQCDQQPSRHTLRGAVNILCAALEREADWHEELYQKYVAWTPARRIGS